MAGKVARVGSLVTPAFKQLDERIDSMKNNTTVNTSTSNPKSKGPLETSISNPKSRGVTPIAETPKTVTANKETPKTPPPAQELHPEINGPKETNPQPGLFAPPTLQQALLTAVKLTGRKDIDLAILVSGTGTTKFAIRLGDPESNTWVRTEDPIGLLDLITQGADNLAKASAQLAEQEEKLNDQVQDLSIKQAQIRTITNWQQHGADMATSDLHDVTDATRGGDKLVNKFAGRR